MLRTIISKSLDRAPTVARDYRLFAATTSGLGVALLSASAAWWLLRRWTGHLVSDIRDQRLLDDAKSPRFSTPILSRVRDALREAEERQRLEIDYRENWTPQALRHVVQESLGSPQIIVASNRQPCIHERDATGALHVQVPASGMVSALEPVMRACSGIWVAHGNGSADREVVDRSDKLRVPADDPAYALRRLWLSRGRGGGLLLRIRE